VKEHRQILERIGSGQVKEARRLLFGF